MREHGAVARCSFGGVQRHTWRVCMMLSLVWAVGIAWSAVQASPVPAPQPYVAAPEVQEPIVPIPLTVAWDPAKVALGERLFHDVRLSHQSAMACATCHPLEKGGVDGLPRARTATGMPPLRNTPTVFNVALNFSYNWDGGVPTLEAHAERVLLHPALMHTTWPALLTRLRADPAYVTAFTAAYAGGLAPASVLDALATYERSLLTPNARFDRYLQGERHAVTAEELYGYQLFKSYGCVACHQGMNVGGNILQKFGIFQDAWALPRPDAAVDLGRFHLTGVARDRGVFRVPSLRNVAVTAPYFHDGRAPTLEVAVGMMARRQLGRTLTHEETRVLVQFLHTLTGEYRGRSLAAPVQEAR